jgi:hypothetical protein
MRAHARMCSKPAPVQPPENVHLYRAAALAYCKAWRDELRRNNGNHKLANPHVPQHAATLAVRKLAPEMSYDAAWWFAHKAVAWVGQAHNAWLSKEG